MTGLLWYDDSKAKSWADKIKEAADRYYKKFGVRPNSVFMHPDDYATLDLEHHYGRWMEMAEYAELPTPSQIAPRKIILRNHIYIGSRDVEGS